MILVKTADAVAEIVMKIVYAVHVDLHNATSLWLQGSLRS